MLNYLNFYIKKGKMWFIFEEYLKPEVGVVNLVEVLGRRQQVLALDEC